MSEAPTDSNNLIKIRRATALDFKDICDNERFCYDLPWTDKMLLECLQGQYVCFVMSQRSIIIGHMIIQQVLDEIHLHNVCVLPHLRGQSLGYEWLDHLNQFAQQQRVKNILLEVRVSNLVAKSLYSKRGFREIGLRKNYYSTLSGQEDALVMKALVSEE